MVSGSFLRLKIKYLIVSHAMADFWNLKEPCRDFLGCPENVHIHCPAYQDRDHPFCEQAETQCRKVLGFEWSCDDCKVFRGNRLLRECSTLSCRTPTGAIRLFQNTSQ
jgi:hypothetical protein